MPDQRCPCPGELYQQMEVDLSSMEMLITSPADEACATMQLQDLLCWLQVRLARSLQLTQPPLLASLQS